MAVYVVMEPPGRGHDADATTFVRDGFSWLGFLAPPLWLLWHRLWIEAGLAVLVIGASVAFGEAFDLQFIATPLTLLVMLLVGLEGQALRIAAMARHGWRQWGVVVADNLDDADARYATDAAGVAPSEPLPEPLSRSEMPVFARPAPIGSIGLVPFSGKH